MKESEHIDMDGNLISMKAKKDKNMYLVPDSTRKQDYSIYSSPQQFNS